MSNFFFPAKSVTSENTHVFPSDIGSLLELLSAPVLGEDLLCHGRDQPGLRFLGQLELQDDLARDMICGRVVRGGRHLDGSRVVTKSQDPIISEYYSNAITSTCFLSTEPVIQDEEVSRRISNSFIVARNTSQPD